MKLFPIYFLALTIAPLTAFGTVIVGSTLSTFAVLGGATVTNTGVSNLFGNLGVSTGTAITGFPDGIVNGTTHAGDGTAALAQSELTTAYNSAASIVLNPCGTVLSGQDLGGLTLTPGTYCFSSSAQLTGTLTLNGMGDPNAQFIFQIASTLTTASDAAVVFTNGGQGGAVFWQVGSSATLGSNTSFAGNVLALADITLNTDANISCGSAWARTGAVTMASNDVTACSAISAVPEPSTGSLVLLIGLPGLLVLRKRRTAVRVSRVR